MIMNNFIPASMEDPCRVLGGLRKNKKAKPLTWQLQLGSEEIKKREAQMGYPNRHKHKLLVHRATTARTSIACPRRWQELVLGSRVTGVPYLFPLCAVAANPRLVYTLEIGNKPFLSYTDAREAFDHCLALRMYGDLNNVKVVSKDRSKAV
jgi:hypothetical protein